MTRVDFYVLSSHEPAARIEVVCKLIDKACARGQKVFVHSDDETLLRRLDTFLWEFRPERFIAHQFIGQEASVRSADGGESDPAQELEPVTLSCQEPQHNDAVFINLARTVPAFFSRFERTLEVVDNQESVRLDARLRYRFYQDRGYPLQHHNL